MFGTPYVFVDIETNGGNGDKGRIIEIAAIKVVDGEIVDIFTSLINPGSDIPYWITRLTGIATNDVIQAPYFDDIAKSLHDFMEGSVFAAHNVLFDYSFIKRELHNAGYTFTPKLFCTVKLSRALYPEVKGHSLEKIINRHNIKVADRHRAYDDALAIYEFSQLTIKKKGTEAFQANIALQLKTKSLPPNVDEAIIQNLPETHGIYIFEDDAGMPLYVGKSINIKARVKSHFTNATTVAKEMKMSLQSHNIAYIETATELEALLLESLKIKELQPLFNRKLRRVKTHHILVKSVDDNGYFTFEIKSDNVSDYKNLGTTYGVYTSRSQAKNRLESITKTFQLCPKLVGLENSKHACFRYQLGFCKGACTGKELPELYNRRAELAFERSRLETWPYKGNVIVTISPSRQLLIDQWIPQKIYDIESDSYTELETDFNIDTYKILKSFLRLNKSKIQAEGINLNWE